MAVEVIEAVKEGREEISVTVRGDTPQEATSREARELAHTHAVKEGVASPRLDPTGTRQTYPVGPDNKPWNRQSGQAVSGYATDYRLRSPI
jgi:hypothetical protein